MWNEFQQGPGYARDFQFTHAGGGGVAELAALIARQGRLPLKAVSELAGSIADMMRQRKTDQIANQFLAQAQAPKATPVNQDELYGEPSATLSGDEMARNQALGFQTTAGTAPDLGGVDALKMYLTQQDRAAKQDALSALAEQRRAKAADYGDSGDGSGAPAGKIWSEQLGGYVTPYQNFLAQQRTQKNQPATKDKVANEMGAYGLRREDLDNLDVARSDVIAPHGNSGQKMLVVTKDGRQATVPWDKWQIWTNSSKLNQGDINQVMTGPDVPAAAGVTPGPAYGNDIPSSGPPLGTKRTINGTPAQWDGNGWVALGQ